MPAHRPRPTNDNLPKGPHGPEGSSVHARTCCMMRHDGTFGLHRCAVVGLSPVVPPLTSSSCLITDTRRRSSPSNTLGHLQTTPFPRFDELLRTAHEGAAIAMSAFARLRPPTLEQATLSHVDPDRVSRHCDVPSFSTQTSTRDPKSLTILRGSVAADAASVLMPSGVHRGSIWNTLMAKVRRIGSVLHCQHCRPPTFSQKRSQIEPRRCFTAVLLLSFCSAINRPRCLPGTRFSSSCVKPLWLKLQLMPVFVPFLCLCVLCPDRDSGDLPLCLVFFFWIGSPLPRL